MSEFSHRRNHSVGSASTGIGSIPEPSDDRDRESRPYPALPEHPPTTTSNPPGTPVRSASSCERLNRWFLKVNPDWFGENESTNNRNSNSFRWITDWPHLQLRTLWNVHCVQKANSTYGGHCLCWNGKQDFCIFLSDTQWSRTPWSLN